MFFVISYQKPHYPVADMLQYKGEIIVMMIMRAYHVLGTLLKCGVVVFSYYSIIIVFSVKVRDE